MSVWNRVHPIAGLFACLAFVASSFALNGCSVEWAEWTETISVKGRVLMGDGAPVPNVLGVVHADLAGTEGGYPRAKALDSAGFQSGGDGEFTAALDLQTITNQEHQDESFNVGSVINIV